MRWVAAGLIAASWLLVLATGITSDFRWALIGYCALLGGFILGRKADTRRPE